jgi:hypothetical protein
MNFSEAEILEPVPLKLEMFLSFHLFLGRPMSRRPFDWYWRTILCGRFTFFRFRRSNQSFLKYLQVFYYGAYFLCFAFGGVALLRPKSNVKNPICVASA